MNNVFSVLIIEDDGDFSDSIKEQLEDYLDDNQLLPKITCRKKCDSVDSAKIGNKYDLVIIDYNLPNNTYGTSFIEKIRSVSLLPDIVFYSSRSSVDEIIENEDKEYGRSLIDILQKGIYFSNSEKLLEVAKQVIEKIIKREEKINGFKGLVLSSVSEYESLVNLINNSLINILPVEKNATISSYVEKLLSSISKDAEKHCIEFSETMNLVQLFDSKNRWLDHYKRTRVMNKLLEEAGINQINFDEYNNNVLNLRNSLGHLNCEQKDGEEFYSFEFNNEIIQLTPNYCKEKRKMLIEWKQSFESILNEIKSLKH